MLTKGLLSFRPTDTGFRVHFIYETLSTESVRLRHSLGMWRLILESDWATRSHAQFPCGTKKNALRKNRHTKMSMAKTWPHSFPRSCSCEHTWSSLRVSVSTSSLASGDIASKLDTNTRTSTDCGSGCWKTPCKIFTDRTRYQQFFTEETTLGPVEPTRQKEREVRVGWRQDPCYNN